MATPEPSQKSPANLSAATIAQSATYALLSYVMYIWALRWVALGPLYGTGTRIATSLGLNKPLPATTVAPSRITDFLLRLVLIPLLTTPLFLGFGLDKSSDTDTGTDTASDTDSDDASGSPSASIDDYQSEIYDNSSLPWDWDSQDPAVRCWLYPIDMSGWFGSPSDGVSEGEYGGVSIEVADKHAGNMSADGLWDQPNQDDANSYAWHGAAGGESEDDDALFGLEDTLFAMDDPDVPSPLPSPEPNPELDPDVSYWLNPPPDPAAWTLPPSSSPSQIAPEPADESVNATENVDFTGSGIELSNTNEDGDASSGGDGSRSGSESGDETACSSRSRSEPPASSETEVGSLDGSGEENEPVGKKLQWNGWWADPAACFMWPDDANPNVSPQGDSHASPVDGEGVGFEV